MAKIDFEFILDKVKTIMTDNLNTKTAAIQSEKGDSITMPSVKDSAYFFQSLDESIANFDPFVAYGIADIESVGQGPYTSEKIFIEIVIVLADNGRSNINRIMFRYLRALKEIFEENWQIDNSSPKIVINRSTVVPFESLDSSAIYKAAGIEIEVNLS